jgi:esterase/lipase superfamily enzyme
MSFLRTLRFCIMLMGLSLAASCADRPRDVLIPMAATVPGASTVDMLVATTRVRVDAPAGAIYSGERARDWSLTNLIVSIPPDSVRKAGDVQWPKALPANPATDFVTLKADPIDPKGARAWFRRTAKHGHRLLVFVHGFNNTFEDAVYRFAQIVHDSGTDAAPVLFTWPSRGSVLDYIYDKESATYSRTALETLLTKANNDPDVSDITVMAHSMGNWVAAEALRQMAIRHGHILPKIRNVILASPDIDVDVFRSQFLDIPPPRPRITLFVSKDDRALAVSRRISGGIDRLGAIDPDIEPYKSKLESAGIVVIDLTKVKTGDSLNHGKFAESPEIVQLIGKRLIAGQQVMASDFSLGERITQATAGAALAVGSTVGAVVTAPIAIVDPATRRNYGHHVNNIGDALSGTAAAATGN